MPDHQHQRARHQQSRNDARKEQRADRRLRGDAVNDHRQRGGNDRADRCGSRRDRARSFRVVALLLHRLDLDGPEARGVGDGRPAHASEDHRADDVRLAQSASHPADDRLREIEDAIADPGRVHQVAHEDEQRRREQRERVRRHRDLLRNDDSRDAGDHQEREAGEPHRRVDRRAEEQRHEPRRENPQHQLDQRSAPGDRKSTRSAARASASA